MSDLEEVDAPEWRLVLRAGAVGDARSGEREPVTTRGEDVSSRSEWAKVEVEVALALELELASE